MTDTTEPLRIPIAHSVRYAARGLPEVPNQYGPGVLAPSEITLTYRAAPDSQLGRVHTYVAGRLWVDGVETPLLPGGLYGQHYDDGLDGWPVWLAEEARLHDPDASVVAPAADRAALRDRIAEELAARFTSGAEHTQGMRVAFEGPDGWPATRMVTPFEAAEAVLSVLPAPADRAAVLREVIERVSNERFPNGNMAYAAGAEWMVTLLERIAAGSAVVDRVAAETPALPSIHDRDVEGFCPACGHPTLRLGDDGHLACTLMDCPKPDAADVLLGPAVVAQPGKLPPMDPVHILGIGADDSEAQPGKDTETP